jgi:alpha-L-rhamnosidase
MQTNFRLSFLRLVHPNFADNKPYIADKTGRMTHFISFKRHIAYSFFVLAMGTASAAGAATTTGPQLTVSNLQTDALIAPLGIADLTPKLSWTDTANVNGAVQTGYEIKAAASAADLTAGQLLWDSGQVQSSAQYAQYGGKALTSRSSVTWQVRVWDGTGAVSAWSAPTTFQIGLTKPNDWTAQWITNPSWTNTASIPAMPLFAKQFTTESGIVSATLYVSGIGIVVPSINGVNVGTAVLAPGSSNLAAHLAYATYDVTSMLTAASSNVLGIELGLGNRFVQPDSAAQGYRYVSPSGATTPDSGLPRTIAQLEITYSNGTTTTIETDNTWQTTLGPTTVSAWWGGEAYDARREVPGWNLPGTKRSSWVNAIFTTAPFPSTQLAPRAAPSLEVVQEIAGTDMGSPVTGSELYNFGVNAAGREQFTISAPAGTTLTFTPAEMLQDGQAFQNAGTTGVPVFDQFTSNGTTETWSPQFSYHGFQYIQVSGITAGVKITSPTLLVVRADNTPVGTFTSSDTTINKVHTLVDRAVQSNMYSVLTDCPSREKGGWDEEVHLLFSMVARGYDIDAYGDSLVQNMADAQLSTGLVPDLVPENIVFSGGFRDDVNWGSAIIQTPWQIYQNYGDTAVLSAYYQNMVNYLNFLQTTHGSGHLVSYGSSGLGDWGETSVTSVTTPIDLVENWGYYRDEVAMANIAKVLGKSADQQKYTTNAAATLAAFTATWYNPSTLTVANGTQSSLAMALDIGAVPASATAAVTQKLVAAINAAGGFAVGEIGITPLFRVLSAAGYHQLIYDAVTSQKIGGYGYFVAQQLTSLPEYWNITSGSRNHWMLGGVDNWITGNIAGIQQASGSVDFQNIVIQPAVVGNMTSASGSFQTNHGTIQSSWSNGSSGFALTATIPVGSTGTINLPITSPLPATPAGATYAGTTSGFAQYHVGAGTYAFTGAGAVAAAANTPPLGATVCAVDYGTCTIPANTTATVWYGAGTVWDEFPSRSGSFTCLPSTFGVADPVPNVQKSCELVGSVPPATATVCAVDYGTCTIPANKVATVWYGAGTTWDEFPSRSGSFTCLPSTFGVADPVPNVQKSCELVLSTAAATTPPATATFCAYDYGTCTIPANTTATVWYGAGTVWDEFPSRSGSFTCLPATFGVADPVPNVKKSCELVTATP